MPSWATFLAEMAPAGPVVQTTRAWGAAFLALVSWAVMSVSRAPKDSLMRISMPNSGPSCSIQRRPSLPKPSSAESRAILVRPLSFR